MAQHDLNHIQINSRRLFYGDQGSGPAVVLIHGAWADADEWDLQIPALTDAGYRVIYPFRAGWGPSDLHSDYTSFHKDAADIVTLMDHLQLDQAVFVGHSAGAYVVLQLYLTWPQRVRALVSIDSAAFGKLDCKAQGLSGYDQKTQALYEKNKDTLIRHGRGVGLSRR